jgi:hypothetical protein
MPADASDGPHNPLIPPATSSFPFIATPILVEGCVDWNAVPASQPFHDFEVIIDTDGDDLASGDELDFTVADSSNFFRAGQTLHSSNTPKLDNDTEHSFTVTPPTPLQSGVVDHFLLSSNEGNDEWHVAGISIFGHGLIPSGQDTCLFRSTGLFVLNSGTTPLPLSRGNGCP